MKSILMKFLLFLVFLLLISLLLGGCFSGTGFEKKATLMPDRIGISFGQQQYKSEDAAWRGFNISAQWDLK